MVVIVLAAPLVSAEGPTLRERMDRRLDTVRAALIEVRHDLHRHPELSGSEDRTADVIARLLRALGFEVRSGVGGHGVVGVLRGGRPGAVVAYRADMDAVASEAPDPAPFRSETPGVRHICGHDVHTAVALGVAEAVSAIRDDLPGTVKLIFQPAEERDLDLFRFEPGKIDAQASGALLMIEAGALENPRPAAIFALHTMPLLTGQIAATPGIAITGRDRIVARFRGAGARNAADAVAATIKSLNTLPPRDEVFADGQLASIESFTEAEAHVESLGSTSDPGVQEWVLKGYVRGSSEANYANAKAAVFAAIRQHVGETVVVDLDYRDRLFPDTFNNPALIEAAVEPLQSVVGPRGALIGGNAVPYFGEDFSFYLMDRPGVMFWLGVSRPAKGIIGFPHAPFYQADDEAIQLGARAMSWVLLDYLESHQPGDDRQRSPATPE